jgi:hypothetical protein
MVRGFDRKDPNRAKDLIVMMLNATQTLLSILPIEKRPTLTLNLSLTLKRASVTGRK